MLGGTKSICENKDFAKQIIKGLIQKEKKS